MAFKLWSRRPRRKIKLMTLDELIEKTCTPEQRERIQRKAKEFTAALQRHYINRKLKYRQSEFGIRPYLRGRRTVSRLKRCVEYRLKLEKERREPARRKLIHRLRSKRWGNRLCPHRFSDNCMNYWKIRIGKSFRGNKDES